MKSNFDSEDRDKLSFLKMQGVTLIEDEDKYETKAAGRLGVFRVLLRNEFGKVGSGWLRKEEEKRFELVTGQHNMAPACGISYRATFVVDDGYVIPISSLSRLNKLMKKQGFIRLGIHIRADAKDKPIVEFSVDDSKFVYIGERGD